MTPGAFVNSLVSSGFVVCLGCSEPTDTRPPDVSGTAQTALRLTLGAEARINDEETVVELCLTPDGLCSPADFRVDECYRYDGIQAFIDGVELPLAWSGGWSPEQRFEPLPSGGNGYGCSYPLFETIDLGPDARSASQEIVIRMGGEEVAVRVEDWLVQATLSVPEILIRGTELFVGLEPRVGSEELGSTGTAFIYDDLGIDDTNKWFDLGEVERESWRGDGFVVALPTTIPTGPGTFRARIGGIAVDPVECPFSGCRLQVISRVVEVPGISVVEQW